MILVLASPRDTAAAALVTGWAGARLLTPADLSLPGWSLPAGPSTTTGPPCGRGVADGQPFRDEEVTCVVVLMAGVEPQDLSWIDAEHRAYVASEMTSFLGHWLTTLGERCLVAPSWASLAGPVPPTAEAARAAHLPLGAGGGEVRRVLTVVGDRVFAIDGPGARPDTGPVARCLLRMAASYDAALVSVVVDPVTVARPRLHAMLPAPILRGSDARVALQAVVAARHREAVAS